MPVPLKIKRESRDWDAQNGGCSAIGLRDRYCSRQAEVATVAEIHQRCWNPTAVFCSIRSINREGRLADKSFVDSYFKKTFERKRRARFFRNNSRTSGA